MYLECEGKKKIMFRFTVWNNIGNIPGQLVRHRFSGNGVCTVKVGRHQNRLWMPRP